MHPFPAREVQEAIRRVSGAGSGPQVVVSLADWTSAVPTTTVEAVTGTGGGLGGASDVEDEEGEADDSKASEGEGEDESKGAEEGAVQSAGVGLARDEDAAGRVEAAAALAWFRGAVGAALSGASAASVAVPAKEWGRARGIRRLLGVAAGRLSAGGAGGEAGAIDLEVAARRVVSSRGIEVVRVLAGAGAAARGAEAAAAIARQDATLAFESGLAPWASNAGVHLQWRALLRASGAGAIDGLSASSVAFLLEAASPTEVVLVDDLEAGGSADVGAALGVTEGGTLRIVDEGAVKRAAEARAAVALAHGGQEEDGGPEDRAAGQALVEALLSREDAACLAVAEGMGRRALALYSATAPRMSVVLEGTVLGAGGRLALGGAVDVLAGARRARGLLLDVEEAAEAEAREKKEAEEAGLEPALPLGPGAVARRALGSGLLGSPPRTSSGASVASGGSSSTPPLADFAPKIAVSSHAVLGLKAAGLAAVVDPLAKEFKEGALGVLGSTSGIERDAGSRVWADGELEGLGSDVGAGSAGGGGGGSSSVSVSQDGLEHPAGGGSVAASVASTARLSRSLRLVPLSQGIILHPAAAAEALEGLLPSDTVPGSWAVAAATSAGAVPSAASGAGAAELSAPATGGVLQLWPAPRSALPPVTLAREEAAAKEAAEAAAEEEAGDAPLGVAPPAPPSVESRLRTSGEAPRHPAMPLLFPETFGSSVRARPAEEEEVFVVKVQAKRRLTPEDYSRNIFHIEFDTRGTGLKYEIGAALGVFGHNDPKEVDSFLRWYGVDGAQAVTLPPPELMAEGGAARELPPGAAETTTVRRAFTQVLDLFGKPGKAFYEKLGAYATDIEERVRLFYYATQEGKEAFRRRAEEENVTFADVLQQFPSAHPPLVDLLTLIPAIKPRHYSIASSQRVHPGSVHLLVVLVDWKDASGRTRTGQCTRYLDGLRVGESVAVSIKPSVMLLPPDHRSPVIMAGLGTGMAPFRAFIEERAWFKQQGHEVGPMVLYFGSRHRHQEYLYGEELDAYNAEGVLPGLRLAFSRDQKEKVYIQHLMMQDREQLAEMLLDEAGKHRGGRFYLCGPTWPEGPVQDAIERSFREARGMTEAESAAKVQELKDDERYILEVY